MSGSTVEPGGGLTLHGWVAQVPAGANRFVLEDRKGQRGQDNIRAVSSIFRTPVLGLLLLTMRNGSDGARVTLRSRGCSRTGGLTRPWSPSLTASASWASTSLPATRASSSRMRKHVHETDVGGRQRLIRRLWLAEW